MPHTPGKLKVRATKTEKQFEHTPNTITITLQVMKYHIQIGQN